MDKLGRIFTPSPGSFHFRSTNFVISSNHFIILSNSLCHSERSEESKGGDRRAYNDFRFFTPLRYVQNDG